MRTGVPVHQDILLYLNVLKNILYIVYIVSCTIYTRLIYYNRIQCCTIIYLIDQYTNTEYRIREFVRHSIHRLSIFVYCKLCTVYSLETLVPSPESAAQVYKVLCAPIYKVKV